MGKYSKDKRDIYYRKAKELGFRARSAFKLLQIDEEFNILQGVSRAVDLCAAPGSWSQVLSRSLYANNQNSDNVKIVAVDLQTMAPIKGVIQIEGDITSKETATQIIASFEGKKADLVVCDGAPDVTGMHDIDEYIQSQLILSALNITTYLLRKNSTFICKIFRGRDINLLYTKLEIFFNVISVAKPKSSRNSSIEAFIVCEGYNPPNDYVPNMDIIQFNNYHELKQTDARSFNHKKTIRFVACGDLSAFDSDANYPLILGDDNDDDAKEQKRKNEYDYIDPLQPPTNPNYKSFMNMKFSAHTKNSVFSSGKNALIDGQNESDLDEDIIHSVDSLNIITAKHDTLEYDDLDALNVSMLNTPNKPRMNAKTHRKTFKNMATPKSKDRKKSRNQIAFYSSLIGAAVVMFYLTKFYYSTHQANDGGDAVAENVTSTKPNNPSIELRKQN